MNSIAYNIKMETGREVVERISKGWDNANRRAHGHNILRFQ